MRSFQDSRASAKAASVPRGWSFLARQLCLFAWCISACANAQVIEIQPAKDNSIYEEDARLSNGLGDLFAGPTGNNFERRALLRFDMSDLAPGTAVAKVTLQVTVDMARTAGGNYALHEVLADWGEGGSLGSGAGALAQEGDATWSHRFYPTLVWFAEGGDFAPDPVSTMELGASGAFTFPHTPEFVELVQSWINQPKLNYGLVIVKRSGPGTAKRLQSRESISGVPVLAVTLLPTEQIFLADFELSPAL